VSQLAKDLKDAQEMLRFLTRIKVNSRRLYFLTTDDVDRLDFGVLVCDPFETVRKAHAAKVKR
jgi:hypothetical protein